MKTFNVPIIYRSPLITAIKNRRRQQDKMKKDFTPALLELGDLHIYLARHFGFCYGVENAIEISFRTIDDNPGRRIFLLSEMIHNPQVNADLQSRGITFLQDTYGRQLIPFEELSAEDIVIIPAFGTTLEIEEKLRSIGIQTEKYNTTCPFVEKVWNRSAQIAKKNYTIIVHGKPGHEETRATFSHAAADTPTVVVKDMQEAKELAKYIALPSPQFYTRFKGQYSEGFDVQKDLQRIGVVNQTTMLASDTQAIADFLKQTMIDTYGLTGSTADQPTMDTPTQDDSPVNASTLEDPGIDEYFADTRDTLCYATLDNQSAIMGLLDTPADLAIVVGGYNSSNTSHLVELCEEKLPTYFISSEEKILSGTEILHYNFHKKEEVRTAGWLPATKPVRILISSGASCPDALVEAVIRKLAAYYGAADKIEQLQLTPF
jgi:4-hydroxy-3-methylbut-2-enyl diphosphate reductase